MTLFEYLAAAYTLILSFAVARLVTGLPPESPDNEGLYK